jgi:hypothetical protein
LASSGWRLGVDLSPTPPHASRLAASEMRQGPLVGSPVSLRYPNGRVHEETLSLPGELRLGDRFELYGRQWSAVELLRPSRRKTGESRMLCVATSHVNVPTQ